MHDEVQSLDNGALGGSFTDHLPLQEVIMHRRIWIAVALVAIVAAAFEAVTAQAAPTAGAICKPVSVSGLKYGWSVIGNVTCAKAAPWLSKLLHEKGTPDAKLTFKNGPKGFHCSAFDDSKGRPSAGGCETGTPAFPKNGFTWLGK